MLEFGAILRWLSAILLVEIYLTLKIVPKPGMNIFNIREATARCNEMYSLASPMVVYVFYFILLIKFFFFLSESAAMIGKVAYYD